MTRAVPTTVPIAKENFAIQRLTIFVAALALSLASLVYCYRTDAINLYGDAIAHLNIARKVVDLGEGSLWTRYLQLGSPWLPLPHLLMLPFIWHDHLWRSGLAGSAVSMLCYLAATLLVFEMAAIAGTQAGRRDTRAGVLAAAIFAFNPSLLYLQTTAMTELPFLAFTALAVFMLLRWRLTNSLSTLIVAGGTTALAMLTRYEAWSLLPAGALTVFVLAPGPFWTRLRLTIIWTGIAALAPLYWLWHNWAIFGNALEFYNGFYSAKNYLVRFEERLGWTGFVVGNVASTILLAGAAVVACAGIVPGLLTMAALVRLPWRDQAVRAMAPLLLLFVPFLFTIYSLFTGNTQIYPVSAISLLNVRYGLTALLPMAILPVLLLRGARPNVRLAIMLALIVIQYGWLVSAGVEQLAVYQEPFRNTRNTRDGRAQAKLSAYLRAHPPQGKILAHSGEFGAAIIKSEIAFRELVFEGLGAWHTDAFLAGVNSVIVKEGDELWRKLSGNKEFKQQFELVYEVGPQPRLMLWRRKI